MPWAADLASRLVTATTTARSANQPLEMKTCVRTEEERLNPQQETRDGSRCAVIPRGRPAFMLTPCCRSGSSHRHPSWRESEFLEGR